MLWYESMLRRSGPSFEGPAGVIAVGALALCCGGPILLAALLTAGIGAWALEHGATLVGGALFALAAIAASVVLLRRRGGQAAEADCCAPVRQADRGTSAKEPAVRG